MVCSESKGVIRSTRAPFLSISSAGAGAGGSGGAGRSRASLLSAREEAWLGDEFCSRAAPALFVALCRAARQIPALVSLPA